MTTATWGWWTCHASRRRPRSESGNPLCSLRHRRRKRFLLTSLSSSSTFNARSTCRCGPSRYSEDCNILYFVRCYLLYHDRGALELLFLPLPSPCPFSFCHIYLSGDLDLLDLLLDHSLRYPPPPAPAPPPPSTHHSLSPASGLPSL